MTDTGDPQDVAEALDADKVADQDGGPDLDQEVEPDYPPDTPLGADDYGVTPAEEEAGEPLAERERRYEPDPLAREQDRSATSPVDEALQHVDDALDDDVRIELEHLTDPEPVLPGDDDAAVGRLVDPTADATGAPDDEADAVADAVEADDLSAEEAAVRVTEDPPMGDPGDGYVDPAEV